MTRKEYLMRRDTLAQRIITRALAQGRQLGREDWATLNGRSATRYVRVALSLAGR